MLHLMALLLLVTTNAYAQNDQDCEALNLIDRISCYTELAKQADDLSACDQSSHEGVKYQCYAIFAEFKLDPAVCLKIPVKGDQMRDLVDSCISDIAKAKKDENLCETIVSPGLKDDCLIMISKQKKDPSICQKITSEERRNWCEGKPTYVE